MSTARITNISWLRGLFIVFAVAAFQIHSIHTTYMREDEEIAYRSTQYDLGYAVRFQAESDVQAPLWFASFWLWQQFMGDSEFMGRVYSIFLSMMTMALVYYIGRRWFGAGRYGLFAMAVLGVNAFFFIYSLEIRPYALVMLASATSMWFFWRWLDKRMWRAAILYGLTLGLMLYIHYFLGFLILVQGNYFLWFVARQKGEHGGSPLQSTRQGIGAGLIGLGLWLPWLPVFIGQIVKLQRLEADVTRGIGISSTTEPTTVEAIVRLVSVITNGQPGLYAIALALGLVYWWRNPHPDLLPVNGEGEKNKGYALQIRRSYILALMWGLGVPVVTLGINLFAPVYTQRYVTYLSVGLALAVGAGLGAIANPHPLPPSPSGRGGAIPMPNPLPTNGEGGQKTLTRNIQRRFPGIMALVGFVALNLWGLPSQLPIHTPYRDLLGNMSAAAQLGDVIFFDHADTNDNYVQWQFRHYLSQELQENSFNNLEQVQNARRIWHVTANWFDDEVRKNFRDIERTHPRQMGFGSCGLEWCYLIQLMEAPPWEEASVFGEDMAFWGADVDRVTPETIRTRLWWRVEQSPELNYSMSLQLLDDSGALVAQFDGPINHYGQVVVETSQLEPGQIYIDHRSIPLPPDLTPGEYRLALVVYQPWDGVRLTLPDGSEALILETVHVS